MVYEQIEYVSGTTDDGTLLYGDQEINFFFTWKVYSLWHDYRTETVIDDTLESIH